MMRYLSAMLLIGLSGCAPVGLNEGAIEGGSGVDGPYQVPKTVRYGYTLQNTSGVVLETAEFWTYAPVKQTSSQRVVRLSVSEPYQLIEDDLGNQVLHFEFKNLPPYGSKIITIQADLLMSEESNSMSLSDAERFLTAEDYVEVTDPKIQGLAGRLKADAPLDTARAIHQWVAGNLRSEAYIPDDRGALYALNHRLGDCTEFMYLFEALSRANGLPARGVGGYVYSGNAILDAVDYHNWAEFYADGAWHVADPQEKVFMQEQANYIAMRIIAGQTGTRLGNTHRFSYSGEGLRVSMN